MNVTHLNITMLRVLDALGRDASLTRAGDRLGLTQSGVSHALKGLNAALGTPVCLRRGRQLELTETGQRAVVAAREALDAINRLCALGEAPVVSGNLRLAAVPSAAAGLVPKALARLARQHPALEVELLEGADDEVRSWHDKGLAELAVGMARGQAAARVLTRDRLMVVLPPDDDLAAAPALALEQLDGRAIVMSGNGCEPLLRDLFAEAGISLRTVATVRDGSSLLAMVRAGLGLTILPALSLSAGATDLDIRPLAPTVQRALWLMQGAEPSPRARAVAEALQAVCDG